MELQTMSHHIARTSSQKSSQNISDLLKRICLQAMDLLTCIYLFVIIVALPLYNKGSYAQIGTDKRNFLNGYLQLHAYILMGLLVLWLICILISSLSHSKSAKALPPLKNRLTAFFRQTTLTDKMVACYFLAVLISTLCTDYPDMIPLGASGWTMGTMMQLSLAAGYFLISRAWTRRLWIVLLMLPVSFVLFALGFCNRFGLWPIAMEYSENPQFLSLAGNINWYCGYLVTILFGGVYLLWSDYFPKRWQRFLLHLYLLTGFASLVTNGSSSGILTLIVILLVLMLMSVSDGIRMERFFEIALLFSLSCLFTLGIRLLYPDAITYQETTNNLFTNTLLPVMLTFLALVGWLLLHWLTVTGRYPVRFFRFAGKLIALLSIAAVAVYVILLICNTHKPGSIGMLSSHPMFTFSREWGSRRGATWMAGWMAFTEQPLLRKLIGVGPDCMPGYLYRDSSAPLLSLLEAVWPGTTLSNAHNEWLTVLVNLGGLGLFCYAGLILSAVTAFLKTGIRNTLPHASLIGACGLAILAYTVHNIVSFQQVLNQPAMFVILGIGAAYSRTLSKGSGTNKV